MHFWFFVQRKFAISTSKKVFWVIKPKSPMYESRPSSMLNPCHTWQNCYYLMIFDFYTMYTFIEDCACFQTACTHYVSIQNISVFVGLWELGVWNIFKEKKWVLIRICSESVFPIAVTMEISFPFTQYWPLVAFVSTVPNVDIFCCRSE